MKRTFGIVALPLAAGLLLAVFLAGVGLVIYYALSIGNKVNQLEQSLRTLYA